MSSSQHPHRILPGQPICLIPSTFIVILCYIKSASASCTTYLKSQSIPFDHEAECLQLKMLIHCLGFTLTRLNAQQVSYQLNTRLYAQRGRSSRSHSTLESYMIMKNSVILHYSLWQWLKFCSIIMGSKK